MEYQILMYLSIALIFRWFLFTFTPLLKHLIGVLKLEEIHEKDVNTSNLMFKLKKLVAVINILVLSSYFLMISANVVDIYWVIKLFLQFSFVLVMIFNLIYIYTPRKSKEESDKTLKNSKEVAEEHPVAYGFVLLVVMLVGLIMYAGPHYYMAMTIYQGVK